MLQYRRMSYFQVNCFRTDQSFSEVLNILDTSNSCTSWMLTKKKSEFFKINIHGIFYQNWEELVRQSDISYLHWTTIRHFYVSRTIPKQVLLGYLGPFLHINILQVVNVNRHLAIYEFSEIRGASIHSG